MLLKLNELNTRATRAEQRVVELEQLLRDHALVALDETCDDSDIVTSTSQHDCFNEVKHSPLYDPFSPASTLALDARDSRLYVNKLAVRLKFKKWIM